MALAAVMQDGFDAMTVLSDAQLHSARSTVNGPMTRSDRVATLEEAKAQFQKSWDAWKAWAKLEETE